MVTINLMAKGIDLNDLVIAFMDYTAFDFEDKFHDNSLEHILKEYFINT
jgi:hypothetical protein